MRLSTFFSIALLSTSLTLFATEEDKMENPDIAFVEDQNDLTIKTPSLQDRVSKKFQLKNGLQVWIISDPQADQSSAALSVNVGAWHDPDGLEGMAHFTEHLLFLGTKNFPKEDELFQFCGHNGGLVNAYTFTDRTVYMFSIQNEAFQPGLERFSEFFYCPVFNKAGIEKELNAVDNEHAKNLESDSRRQFMLLKTLGNPKHNNRKFSTGTAETLKKIPYDTLVNWYKEHYGANKMALVIYTKHPLDETVAWVNQYFSSIPEAKQEHLEYHELLSPTLKGHVVYQKPVKDLRNLTLLWDVPKEYASDLDSHTPDLVAYALNQKTENSLYELLRKEGLIETMAASYSNLGGGNGLFEISMDLTKQGVEDYEKIISSCYQALYNIKTRSIPAHIYQEMKQMAELKYEYQSRGSAFRFASTHAHQLLDESLSSYPRKHTAPTSFHSDKIRRFANTLTPEKAAVFFTVSPELGSWKPEHKEKWYGAEYSIVKIEREKLSKWKGIGAHPDLGHPFPNAYIPDHATLVHKEAVSALPIEPKLIENDPLGKLYLYEDAYYQTPKLHFTLNLRSPEVDDQARSFAMLDLLSLWQYRELSTLFSNANRAGIHPSIQRSDFALKLKISGFSDKALLFTNHFLTSLKQMQPEKASFEIIKDELLSDYYSKTKEIAFFQAYETTNNLLQNCAPTAKDLYQALEEISFNDFAHFREKFFQSIYIEGLVGGNITETRAKELWQLCNKYLASAPYSTHDQIKKKVLILPEAAGPFSINTLSELQGNAAFVTIQLGTYTFEKRASQLLLLRAFSEAFFQELRTKQQLGYIVKAGGQHVENQLFIFMAAQSAFYAPEELIARFEHFTEDYLKSIDAQINEEKFEEIRNSLIIQISEPPRNLSEYSDRLFTYAYDYDGEFDRHLQLLEAVKALDYKTFLSSSRAFLSRNNTRRVAIECIDPRESNLFRYTPSSKKQLLEMGRLVTKTTSVENHVR